MDFYFKWRLIAFSIERLRFKCSTKHTHLSLTHTLHACILSHAWGNLSSSSWPKYLWVWAAEDCLSPNIWLPRYIHPRKMNVNWNKHILSNRVKRPFPSLSTLGSVQYFLFLFVDGVIAEVGPHCHDVAEWRVASLRRAAWTRAHSTLLPFSQNRNLERQTREPRSNDSMTSRSVI